MTLQEFHIAIDIELDKTLDFEYPYISSEQKDYWLNKAQDRFVKSRAFGNNPKLQGFEESEKRIDDLQTIVKTNISLTTSSPSTNLYTSPLPIDYLYLMRHQAKVLSTCINTNVSGKQVTQDNINILLKDPFWTPIAEEPLYYIANNNIIYETKGGFSISNSIITYIKQYNKIQYGTTYISPIADINCELPEHTHSEIVDIATSMLLENIESQRYQTNLNELTKSE